MADEQAKERPVEQAPPKSSKKKTIIMGGALLGAMVVEAVVVFVLVKHFAVPPATAEAGILVEGVEGEGEAEAAEGGEKGEKAEKGEKGEGGEGAEGEEAKKATEAKKRKRLSSVEVEVVRLRAQNERSQRQLIYDLEVYLCVSGANEQKVTEILQRRKATVQDRLARVVRAAEPERFSEPDLLTLRKQFLMELNQIVGEEGLIQEVLIPSIVSSEG